MLVVALQISSFWHSNCFLADKTHWFAVYLGKTKISCPCRVENPVFSWSQPADIFGGGQNDSNLMLHLTTKRLLENFRGGELPGCSLWLRPCSFVTYFPLLRCHLKQKVQNICRLDWTVVLMMMNYGNSTVAPPCSCLCMFRVHSRIHSLCLCRYLLRHSLSVLHVFRVIPCATIMWMYRVDQCSRF